MQSSDYSQVRNELQKSVLNYYRNLRRDAAYFRETEYEEGDGAYLYFFLDKKHVIRYGFSSDRQMWVGGLELGIGPEYFAPAYFWSYDDSTRFVSALDTQSVFHNLRLMDEFLHRDIPQYVIK